MTYINWVTESNLWCHKTFEVDLKKNIQYWLNHLFFWLLADCFPCQPFLDIIKDQCQSKLVRNLASWIFFFISLGFIKVNNSKSSLATVFNSYWCKLSSLADWKMSERDAWETASSPWISPGGWLQLSSPQLLAPEGSSSWMLQPSAVCDQCSCQPCLSVGLCP